MKYARVILIVTLVVLSASILMMVGTVAGQGESSLTPYGILYTDGSWATMTPVATTAPVPTGTPAGEASPTPEISLSPTIPPVLQTCELKLRDYAINLRATPGGTWIKTLAARTTQEVSEFYQGDTYLYAYTGEGWFVIRDTEWWVIGVDGSTETCQDLPGWPAGLAPPVPVVRNPAGLHLLFDTLESRTVPLFSVMGTIKTITGAEKLGAAFKAQESDGVWVHRGIGHDIPTLGEWDDPYAFIRRIEGEWSAGADYYEFINETIPPSWPLFRDFTIRVLDYAGERGVCLLWGSFAAGQPEDVAWFYLTDVIEWADQHPCRRNADGSYDYHGIAFHLPLLVPEDIPRQTGTWMDDPYIAGRLTMVDAMVNAYSGAGLAGHASGFVYVTEAGLDDGYSGAWDDEYSCQVKARSFWHTVRQRAVDWPFVRGWHFWTWGDGRSIWTDSSVCWTLFYSYA